VVPTRGEGCATDATALGVLGTLRPLQKKAASGADEDDGFDLSDDDIGGGSSGDESLHDDSGSDAGSGSDGDDDPARERLALKTSSGRVVTLDDDARRSKAKRKAQAKAERKAQKKAAQYHSDSDEADASGSESDGEGDGWQSSDASGSDGEGRRTAKGDPVKPSALGIAGDRKAAVGRTG